MARDTSVSLDAFFVGEFAKLAQKGKDCLAIFDLDLRYLLLNDAMATLNGKPVEELLGRNIHQADPAIASVLEPLLQAVVRDQTPILDREARVPQVSVAELEPRCWLVSCYPLCTPDGTLRGCGVVFHDVAVMRLRDVDQEERLKFEALLSDLSATFINVDVGEVDGKIENALQKIVEFLGFDRSTIWHVSPEDGRLHATHTFAYPGIPHPPAIIQEDVPVWTGIVNRGEFLRISNIDDLPDQEFSREKEYCRKMGGIKSNLFIPLLVGGINCGVISFISYKPSQTLPEVMPRLRLLSEIIENALERKRADQKIQRAISEIEELKNRLEAENHYLRDQIETVQKHGEIVGESAAIKKVLKQVEQVGPTDSTVLVLGETGTGKELLARALHEVSPRRGRTMVKVNCAALPASLIEMELFGREKGAYTGAFASQVGRFEAANGSTIFLDEIGELPLELQSKLLRVLQEGQFERLGSPKPVEVDVRVVAATNRDLAKAVKEGSFREDLFYRLNVFPVSVPPLRERSEDIPLLVWAMVQEFGKVFGKTIERIPKKNMDTLARYPWPGNIRELRNVVERAMILNSGPVLVVDLPENAPQKQTPVQSLEENERMHILSVLESTGWRVRGKEGAAEILDIKPTTLDAKMKKLGIVRQYLPRYL